MNTIKIYSRKLFDFLWLLVLLATLLISSCKKYLDEKPIISDVIPQTLTDLQALLDNSLAMNGSSASTFSELVADNYYVTTAIWQLFNSIGANDISQETQNYIWSAQAIPPAYWNLPYQGPIYYSNIVLDHLPLVNKGLGEDEKYNSIKGSALFYRAFAFHNLAQLFCLPYSQDNASSPGIVLRLTSNVGENVGRATVQQTYNQIIADLKEAATLLPLTSQLPTRPTQTAAYAELARVYLSMRDYVNAGQYADLALQQKGNLLDYNTLLPAGNTPFTIFNPEVIFHSFSPNGYLTNAGQARIDTMFYQSFDNDDLRKVVFFRPYSGANTGYFLFKGSYAGDFDPFGVFDGLATDELYLIRAESAARAGDKDAALADLNALMIKRWSNTVTYPTITATDANDALVKVLIERRKELVWRGIRWSDVRRFNLEGANITLKRIIDGIEYTLPPNDPRIVLLIPWEEIDRSGIEQNQR